MTGTQKETVPTSNNSVLVVDDNVANLKVISRLLQEEDCRVLTARDGKSCLEKAHHGRPDLILLDVMMPGMDGFETCKRLKSDETLKNIPVIFMTALTGIDDKVRGFKIGAVDYITKPFQPEEVLVRVSTHLRLRELTEHLEHVVDQRTRELQEEIIEREKTQEQLRESERRYSEIVEGTDDLITEVDDKGRFLFVNATASKIWGISPSECVGMDAFDFIHPDDREKTFKNFLQWIKEKRSGFFYENRQISKSGKITDVHWTVNLHFDEMGEVASIRSIARDITEQKKAEIRLRESEEKFRTMMESFADPLYICSPDFKVSYMNPAMITRLGRDATGEACHSAIHGLDNKCQWCVSDDITENGTVEYTILSPLDQRNYRVTKMPIHHADGTISAMTIFKDITDYLSAVKEKEQAQSLLIQAQKMEAIGTLAGGIAHDFNNILGVIVGQAELIDIFNSEENSPAKPRLKHILEAAERAQKLVRQILTISRYSSIASLPVDLVPLAKEVVKFIRSSAPANITIRESIAGDKMVVSSDPSRMHQVFLNLLSNAVQAMANTDGTLDITMRSVELSQKEIEKKPPLTEGIYIMIVVRDTGPGIPQHVQEKIFEPYYTTKAEGEGTGLGLAVVHGVVKTQGGHISVDSQPGKGTTFKILLPQIDDDGSSLQDTQDESLIKGSESVLLVDDNVQLIKTSSTILTHLGYHVTECTDPIAALHLFKKTPQQFDLVITDLTMPHLSGIQLFQELVKIRPDIPGILCSGFGMGVTEESAKKEGFKAFLYKPLSTHLLSHTISSIMKK